MENFTRAFTVSGNVITDSKPTKKAGNAGENIVTSLSFTFSSEWDNAIKSIVFKSPKNKLLTPQTITGSVAPIPVDALDSGGTLQFSLMGAFADSEQVIRTPTYGLDVESTLSILGGTPLATYTNVVIDCQTATQEAITAKDAAVLATERIETTDTDIKAAEAIREAERLKWTNATAQATTLEPDELATASVTDSETGKVFNIGVPQGIPGIKGDKGDKGDTGATGATGAQGIQGIPGEVTAAQLNAALTLKADKAQDTPVLLTPLSGWSGSIKIRKSTTGLVTVSVDLLVGTGTQGTAIASIPAAYRPINKIPIPCVNDSAWTGLIAIAISNDVMYNLYTLTASQKIKGTASYYIDM